ncbi:MAG: hypothetical protein JWN48_2224 [Myxococcaceae bacterium]|nr:hypothetical protein [Myxococcaceae bacterium]
MRVSNLMKLLACAACLSLVLGATCSSAAAQAIVLRRPALHWVRSDEAMSCIDPRTLAEHVEALIGPVLVRPSEAEHTIEGQVDSIAPGRLRVRVRVLDMLGNKVGEREFEQPANDCKVLTPAIVFVIGMAIDPEVAAHGLPPALLALLGTSDPPPGEALLDELERNPAVHTAPHPLPPAPTRVGPPKLLPAPVDRRPFQASGFVRGALGESPGKLLSLDARLLYAIRAPFSIGTYVRGGVQATSHHYLSHRDFRMGVIDAGVLSCLGQSSLRRFRLQGCAGLEASLALGSGSGAPGGDTRDALGAFGLVAQLTGRLRLWRQWGLAVLANGRFITPRRTFAIENRQKGAAQPQPHRAVVVARLPWFSGGVGLGATYEF